MRKLVNGVVIEMTPEEEAAFEADRTPTLPRAKRAKKHAIIAAWVKAERNGVVFQAKTVETGSDSLARLGVLARRARQAKDDGVPFPVSIVAADDSILNLSRAELLLLDQAVGDHFKACSDNAKALLQATRDAADLAAVAAVDESAGWP